MKNNYDTVFRNLRSQRQLSREYTPSKSWKTDIRDILLTVLFAVIVAALVVAGI